MISKLFQARSEKSSYFLERVTRFAQKSDFLTNLHSQNTALLSTCQFNKGSPVKVSELESQLEKLLFGKPCDKQNVYGLRTLWYNLLQCDQKSVIVMVQLQSNKGLCNMYLTAKGEPVGMVYYSRLTIKPKDSLV